MARKTKAEAEQTRRRILMVALDLFADRGYDRTTFEDIAKRIGLSKGAVYWHFKSKPVLLTALVSHMIEEHAERFHTLSNMPKTLGELRDQFVYRADIIMRHRPSRKFFGMMMRLDWSVPKLQPVKRRLMSIEAGVPSASKRTLGMLLERGEIKAGTDVETVSRVLGALWLGLVKCKLDQGTGFDLTYAIELAFDLLTSSLLA